MFIPEEAFIHEGRLLKILKLREVSIQVEAFIRKNTVHLPITTKTPCVMICSQHRSTSTFDRAGKLLIYQKLCYQIDFLGLKMKNT